MKRRTFLKQSLSISAAIGFSKFVPKISPLEAAADLPSWRTFEVKTRVEIINRSGVTRVWLPLTLTRNTDYFRVEKTDRKSNANAAQVIRDEASDVDLLYAEWPNNEKAPYVELTNRFSTRNRHVTFETPHRGEMEDAKVLNRYLQPSTFIPVDGIVAETSKKIVAGMKTDLSKAQAIYEWIVENTFRDPKVRGCGRGDIKTMLETGNLGGKCADINALYVGLASASGLPARDVYGIRVAPSQEFKCLGRDGDITKAQHCRAEVYLEHQGWVPVDPADVRKVIIEEEPNPLTLQDPIVKKARAKLFGGWEMNWMPYNYGHDIKLPNSSGPPIAFLMYPQAETDNARKDSLDPLNFRYEITSREITL